MAPPRSVCGVLINKHVARRQDPARFSDAVDNIPHAKRASERRWAHGKWRLLPRTASPLRCSARGRRLDRWNLYRSRAARASEHEPDVLSLTQRSALSASLRAARNSHTRARQPADTVCVSYFDRNDKCVRCAAVLSAATTIIDGRDRWRLRISRRFVRAKCTPASALIKWQQVVGKSARMLQQNGDTLRARTLASDFCALSVHLEF